MKPFQRKFTPEAKHLLRHMSPAVKRHLRALTDGIRKNPYEGKALQRELTGYYSVKHSHYRIIYSINEEKEWVVIEYVGLREDIYELFFDLIKKAKKSS